MQHWLLGVGPLLPARYNPGVVKDSSEETLGWLVSLLSVPGLLRLVDPQSGAWRCLGAISAVQHLGGRYIEKRVGLLHSFHDRFGDC